MPLDDRDERELTRAVEGALAGNMHMLDLVRDELRPEALRRFREARAAGQGNPEVKVTTYGGAAVA